MSVNVIPEAPGGHVPPYVPVAAATPGGSPPRRPGAGVLQKRSLAGDIPGGVVRSARLFSAIREGTVVKPWLAGTQQPHASKAAEVISTSDGAREFHSPPPSWTAGGSRLILICRSAVSLAHSDSSRSLAAIGWSMPMATRP